MQRAQAIQADPKFTGLLLFSVQIHSILSGGDLTHVGNREGGYKLCVLSRSSSCRPENSYNRLEVLSTRQEQVCALGS